VDMRSLMKQAQQMQQRLADAREKLDQETAEASTGGGMVTAVVNGKHELLSLKIKPEAVDPEDVEMLEDMIIGAINEAGRIVTERVSTEMGKLTGGMGMPGMF
jgi:nucleoid-associated protein EbfC